MTLEEITKQDIDVLEKRKFKKIIVDGKNQYAIYVCLPDSVDPSDLELSLLSSKSPKITEVTSPGTANTEFSHTFDENTKQFFIRPEKISRVEYSYVSGGDTMNVGLGGGIERTNVLLQSPDNVIYLKCNQASIKFKIEEWK